MTTLTTNVPTGFGLIASLRDALRRRSTYVTVRNELSALTDRELEDIGLHRMMIAEIAAEAAAAA